MNAKYKPALKDVLEALESIPKVKGTTSTQYRDALKAISDEVEAWFEANINAANDDIEAGR